jgi:hypothetical protein
VIFAAMRAGVWGGFCGSVWGRFNGNLCGCTIGPLLLSPLGLVISVPFAVGGGLAVNPLSFGRLPATNLAQAVRILAVTLIPTLWLINVTATLAKTSPLTKSSATGRSSRLPGILIGSHGR